MQEFILYFSVISLSYLCGAVPWGLLIGKMHGIDIRKCGSGNIGATNVTRTVGKAQGRICFALDFLKGMLPVLAVKLIFDDPDGALIICAFSAAVAGHLWSCFARFKGGKGVSTIAGALLATVPVSCLIAAAAWILVYFIFKYVSLASIAAAVAAPSSALLLDLFRLVPLPASLIIFCFVLGVLVIFKHRSNIKRLLNGEEHCFKSNSID